MEHYFRLDVACKASVVAIMTVTLLGCATVKDIASQTPIISMAYDGLQAYQLIDLATQDDSMTDEEVRAMMNRPLPKPPGISYTVALLRRAGAALALGETRVVEDAYLQARANQVSPELQNSILELVVMGHAGNGDIKKARAISLDLEKAYRSEAQKGGLAPNVWPGKHAAFYGMMLAVSSGMGDRQLFFRLMNEYPPDLDAVPKLSESSRALYVLSRKTMMYSLLSEEGDYEGALIAAKECQQIQERRIASASGSDRKHLVGSTITMHRQVSEMNSLLRRPDAALQHVKSMRYLAPDTDSAQMARSNIHAAEATHLASIGHYDEALRNFDNAYAAMLRVFKSQKVVQESYMRDRARLQVASGKYSDALTTIERLGSLDSMSISHYRTSLVALRAFARAASGQTTQDLSPLDALDKEMSKRIGTDSARFHFAVSTYTHLAAFKGNKRENSLRQSIRSGRLFSDSYKKLRSTGQHGDVFTPKAVFDRAKAAYLMATLSSVGKWDVSIDDVLDAFSLYYDSITDEDVSSAALRAGIPGLSVAEVRALLDLRVAARRDAKNLEVISRSAERLEIERAAETAERARRAFDSEVSRLGMKAPGLANIVGIHPPQLGDIRKELLPFEALVALAPTPDGTGALMVAKNRLAYRWLPISSDKLDSLINKVRLTTRISQTSSRAPRFAAAAAHELYQELMSWAASDLKGLQQLSIVSRGSLSSIPFGLLVTHAPGDRQDRDLDWLIRDYAVSQAPSITSWMLAARGATKAPRTLSFVAWADPDFGGTRPTVQVAAGPKVRGSVRLRNARSAASSSPQSLDWSDDLKDLDPLPDTLDEAVGIAHALGVSPDDTILAGRNATRRSVLSMSASGQLATKNIVLFATHGLTPSDLGGRIQQPALAMSLDSADRAPPLLTLEDVMKLRMNAEWVLLSACNTASADSVDGDAISGLARGFIFAGAKSLLATHWSVESESSKALTQTVMSKYQSTPSLTRAQALQAASLSLIDGQNVAADWTHPVFWAPFSLVGNGQR